MIETIKNFLLMIIPRFIEDDVAIQLTGDGWYEIICSMKHIAPDEQFSGWIHLDSVFTWFNVAAFTTTGEEQINPWNSWKGFKK
jgi:hypothetical protein